MKVELQMYAVARQLAGRSVVAIELPDSATVGQLRSALVEAVPALAPLAPRLMFAVAADYARDDAQIPEGAEVACIPPVSGG